jgi:ATP synthase protein I
MKKTPDDIENLGRRIALLRDKEAVLRHEKEDMGVKARASRIGLRVCADLLSAVIVGAALGYVLDEMFSTKPWCLVVFLIFGGAAGVLNVYRLAKAEEMKD